MPKKFKPNLDSVASLNADGSRNFLRPASPKGKYTTYRRILGFFLIVLYVLLPWIPINGNPALLFDVLHLRFHIFGFTFVAQDFWLTFFLISGLGFTLFVVTSLYGRIWCGWTCPQTVFLEHVYRRVERLIEGNVSHQKKLDKLPWSDSEKLIKRGSKHIIFVLLSLLITHVFLAYFISIRELYQWIQQSPAEHWPAFIFVFVASGVLYFNFAWFREQLCLAICPYGRLQSALIDDDSIIIGYDEIRGEPRGKPRDKGVGDCIDCNSCVSVCPTGIDIRQGLQLECVGCSNCIDACDSVMTRLNRSPGLIRYDSMNGFSGKGHRFLRPRLFVYIFFLLLGLAVMSFSFTRIKSAYMMVTRMSGAPFYQTEEHVRNQYNVRIINKRATEQAFHVQIASDFEHVKKIGLQDQIYMDPLEEIVVPLVVIVEVENYKEPFKFDLIIQNKESHLELTREVYFLGPNIKGLNEELVFE